MTDNATRLAEAEQARAAWERFTGPALKKMRAGYVATIATAAGDRENNGNREIIAHAGKMIQAIDELCGRLAAVIFAGDTAQAEAKRQAGLNSMDDEQRRWATY